MAKRGEVGLGDEVEDAITGLAGTVVAITQWLNGCERITIQARAIKDGLPVDGYTVDVEQIHVRVAVKELVKAASGGPYPEPRRTGG